MDLTQILPNMVPFVGTVGIQVDSIEPGTATATLPYRTEVGNHMGTAHAGAVYSLGETASGGVLLSVFADQLGSAYIALKSAQVKHHKARPGDVVAQATLVGDAAATRAAYEATGKADFDVQVDLNVGDTRIAEVLYTWAVRKPR
jgi:uncharacterized protein (TIGR00369 family)